MQGSTKGRNQGRNPEAPETEVWLSAYEVAQFEGITTRAVRNNCDAGNYPGCRKMPVNGGNGWKIPLQALTGAARAKYFKQQATLQADKAKPSRLTRQDGVSLNEPTQGEANNSTGNAATKDHAYRETLWEHYEKSTRKQKEKAQRAVEIAHVYQTFERSGISQPLILQEMEKQFGKGASKATLWRIRKAIKGQDEGIWLPLLMPEWKGKTHCAPFTEAAWEYIIDAWGRQSQPSLKAVYRSALKAAAKNGWKIPSYDTVKARVNALPHDQKVWLREGEKALERLYPAQKRDYSTLPLHEIWCSDGHKADVFVKDEAGEIFRPMVVGWMDVRSRSILGWSVGKSETADMVRNALRQAITRSNAVPREALMDNGRAFASKEITGGVPNRYRFKVNEDDILGVLPLLGIGVIWATPGHGQAKPIEPFWRNLTEMAKRIEFEKAYCGNNPDAKPENFDKQKAVPLALFKQVLGETMADYHARQHRGDGMDGKSPQQIYDALAKVTSIRQPTAAQIRLCLMSAEATRLKGEEGSIQLNGNRYWSDKISGLSRAPTYNVRYNPECAQEPVYLYLNERFICEVPIIGDVAFRNRDEAKEHIRRRRSYMKSVKQSNDALAQFRKSESGIFRLDTEVPDPESPAMPHPKIAEPVRLRLQMPILTKQTEEEKDTLLLSPEQFMEMLARKQASNGR